MKYITNETGATDFNPIFANWVADSEQYFVRPREQMTSATQLHMDDPFFTIDSSSWIWRLTIREQKAVNRALLRSFQLLD